MSAYFPGMRWLASGLLIVGLLACPAAVFAQADSGKRSSWSAPELKRLRSLSLERLPSLPHDPSNRQAGQPAAAELGHFLFFDPKLSGSGEHSCATCHRPEEAFTDGLPLSRGAGTTTRGAPTLIGIAYSPWFYWDGRRDSLWAQALSPLEGLDEMAGSRVDQARYVLGNARYAQLYRAAFGEVPDIEDAARFRPGATPRGTERQKADWIAMSDGDRALINGVFARIGKAIAAYERLLRPAPSRFDQYVSRLTRPKIEAVTTPVASEPTPILSAEEIEGLRLFISTRTNCVRCHNGPLFSNHGFHNIGSVSRTDSQPDLGRVAGLRLVLEDPFNCLGPFSDAQPQQCTELRFMKRAGDELAGAFKVPTLRNVTQTAPYFHDGSAENLKQVLEHYSNAVPGFGHQELVALQLTDREKSLLIQFLATLSSPVDAEQKWLHPPADADAGSDPAKRRE